MVDLKKAADLGGFCRDTLHRPRIAQELAPLICLLVLGYLIRRACSTNSRLARCRRPQNDTAARDRLNQKKPPWVSGEVLRLKALMPHNGCRKIAATFNHMHRRRGESIGKTYVANVLRDNGHKLAEIRRDIRRRKPRLVPRNLIWGLDLTYLGHPQDSKPILGIVDHGTRACIALRGLPSKGSIIIIRALLDAVERFGKPKILRTDNEAIFTSKLFRLGLWILGIRHQRTAPFAPWQNGRIERFFGSFKQCWRLRGYVSARDVQRELDIFRSWYNHVRPHNNLEGRTPAMAWDRRGPRSRGRPVFVSEWGGVLAGFYFPM